MIRPRVVHVVVAGEIGGAERLLVDLAARGEETGADHAVALLTPTPRLARALGDAGLRVHAPERAQREGPLSYLRTTFGARDVAWIAAVLRAERASIAHLHTFASHVVGTRAALRAGVRVLRTEHSTRAFDDPSCWPFSRWSLARADASVAVSEHVRAAAAARAPWAAGKVRVVTNGVDPDRFAPGGAGPSPAFTFAVVARLERRKGVDLAVDALARVPGARLEIAGGGPERAALERRVRARGVADRVRFHGEVDDPRPVLARAGAVLCPSRAEGLGLALLEAMAMGRPVVGFAVGGVPEVVVDGVTGWLAPAGDVNALASCMREAAAGGEPAHRRGAAARERVVARFSIAAMRAGYARAYADLAGGSPPVTAPVSIGGRASSETRCSTR